MHRKIFKQPILTRGVTPGGHLNNGTFSKSGSQTNSESVTSERSYFDSGFLKFRDKNPPQKICKSNWVYGRLQQIYLQRPGYCGPPKFSSFAAKPFAATFLTFAALLFAAGHLQQVISSKIGHLQRPFAATNGSKINHMQQNKPFAAK